MLRLEHDTDASRRELFLQPVRDLNGHPLLDLQPSCEELDDARQLRQPENAVARDVADVGDADERQHVVLAQRREGMSRARTSSS